MRRQGARANPNAQEMCPRRVISSVLFFCHTESTLILKVLLVDYKLLEAEAAAAEINEAIGSKVLLFRWAHSPEMGIFPGGDRDGWGCVKRGGCEGPRSFSPALLPSVEGRPL